MFCLSGIFCTLTDYYTYFLYEKVILLIMEYSRILTNRINSFFTTDMLQKSYFSTSLPLTTSGNLLTWQCFLLACLWHRWRRTKWNQERNWTTSSMEKNWTGKFSTMWECQSVSLCICVYVPKLWGSLEASKMVRFGWNLAHLFLGWISGGVFFFSFQKF